MNRLALLASAAVCGLVAMAPRAAAQNTCDLVTQRGTFTAVGAEGSRIVNAQGPLLVRCTNVEELRADSAVLYQAQNEVYLYRQVDYQDPGKALTSDAAIYNSATGRLYATGNVVFTDKQQGSTLRGPELEYFRAQAGRPQSQATALQRPHVTVRPKSSGSSGQRRNPLEIDADRVTSVGDRYMTATGNVIINDNGTRSTAEEAYYDQATDHVELRRRAQVINEKYQLFGDFIASDLANGALSKVLAQTNARLVSDRLTVTGPQLQLFFERELLQRMVSGRVPGSVTAPVTPAPPAAPRDSSAPRDTSAAARAAAEAAARPVLPPAERSVALSKGFRLEADSLEAIVPEQQLKQVNAVGRARGESWDTLGAVRVLQDTGAAAVRPDTATRVLTQAPDAIDQKDVLTADTIYAFFITDSARTARDTARGPRLAGRPANAAADTARRTGTAVLGDTARRATAAQGDTARTEIDRLLAIGDAHSIYRTRPDTTKPASAQRPGINYLVGDRIDMRFKEGEVDVAFVRGLKRGVYLDPQQPGDSASTDSTGARTAGRNGTTARPGSATGQPATRTGTAPASGVTRPPASASPSTKGTRGGNAPAQTPPAPAPRAQLAPRADGRGGTLALSSTPAGGGAR